MICKDPLTVLSCNPQMVWNWIVSLPFIHSRRVSWAYKTFITCKEWLFKYCRKAASLVSHCTLNLYEVFTSRIQDSHIWPGKPSSTNSCKINVKASKLYSCCSFYPTTPNSTLSNIITNIYLAVLQYLY